MELDGRMGLGPDGIINNEAGPGDWGPMGSEAGTTVFLKWHLFVHDDDYISLN